MDPHVPLGSKELFDTLLGACASGDVQTLKTRRDEFLQNEQNFLKCIDHNGDTILHKAVLKVRAAPPPQCPWLVVCVGCGCVCVQGQW